MKITIVGGGSYAWAPALLRDFLLDGFLDDLVITLLDISPSALEDIRQLFLLYRRASPAKRIELRTTTKHEEALADASWVIVSISHGGLEAEIEDHRIARRYGFYNIKGSEVGVAGCSRTLRHAPELVRIGRLMERYCPMATLLNVTNPLTALTRAVNRYTSIPAVGFCHGVPNHLGVLFPFFGADSWDGVEFTVAGVDHCSWLLDLRYKGTDALATMRSKGLIEAARAGMHQATYDDPFAGKENARLRFLLWDILGYLPALNDEHSAEFFGQFLKDAATRAHYGVTYDRIAERTRAAKAARVRVAATLREDSAPQLAPSGESVARFVAARSGGGGIVDVLNVPNQGQIPNLPAQSVVETRCAADATGVHPLHAGSLPPLLESLVRPVVIREELYMEAAVENDPAKLQAALSTDPLVNDFRSIRELCAEMLRYNSRFRNPMP